MFQHTKPAFIFYGKHGKYYVNTEEEMGFATKAEALRAASQKHSHFCTPGNNKKKIIPEKYRITSIWNVISASRL